MDAVWGLKADDRMCVSVRVFTVFFLQFQVIIFFLCACVRSFKPSNYVPICIFLPTWESGSHVHECKSAFAVCVHVWQMGAVCAKHFLESVP